MPPKRNRKSGVDHSKGTIDMSKSAPKNVRKNMPKAYIKRLKVALNKQKIPPVASLTQSADLVTTREIKHNQKISVSEEARQRLDSARFRYLNEKLYTKSSAEAWTLFQEDPESFHIYHKGFKNQVKKWALNPLDIIVSDLLKGSKGLVVADFGCGEAQLQNSIPNLVYSFDLVAANDKVTACDMSNVPLSAKVVDVAVFCLSLMGSNIHDFIKEANRVLKIGGTLYIAEVESRCKSVQEFLKAVERFGFKLQENNVQKYFFLAKFNKIHNLSPKSTLPRINLKPCLYKKR